MAAMGMMMSMPQEQPVRLGPNPTPMTCPSCKLSVVTKTKRKATMKTHCWCCVLFLFLCWPCACIPYCIDSCGDIQHYCPSCNAYRGTYSK